MFELYKIFLPSNKDRKPDLIIVSASCLEVV